MKMGDMLKSKRSVLLLLPWAALPLTLSFHLANWQRLPPRLAIHFNSSGAADGWLGRWELLAAETALLLFLLVRYTLRLAREEATNWWPLVSFYAAISIVTSVFIGLLLYNL